MCEPENKRWLILSQSPPVQAGVGRSGHGGSPACDQCWLLCRALLVLVVALVRAEPGWSTAYLPQLWSDDLEMLKSFSFSKHWKGQSEQKWQIRPVTLHIALQGQGGFPTACSGAELVVRTLVEPQVPLHLLCHVSAAVLSDQSSSRCHTHTLLAFLQGD